MGDGAKAVHHSHCLLPGLTYRSAVDGRLGPLVADSVNSFGLVFFWSSLAQVSQAVLQRYSVPLEEAIAAHQPQ